METMTIKELAEVAGCSIITVRRTIKGSFPDLTKKGKVTKLNKEQAFDIMAKLPKRNSLDHGLDQKSTVGISREDIAFIVAETVKALMPFISTEKKSLPELPPINYRLELSAIIRAHASKKDMLPGLVWTSFYQRVLYRLRINITTQAKNSGMEVLDWAEENGYIEQLYQLAKEEF